MGEKDPLVFTKWGKREGVKKGGILRTKEDREGMGTVFSNEKQLGVRQPWKTAIGTPECGGEKGWLSDLEKKVRASSR